MRNIIFILLYMGGVLLHAQNIPNNELAIIPYPNQFSKGNGEFILNSSTKIVVHNADFEKEADYLQSLIRNEIGSNISIAKNGTDNVIVIELNNQLADTESYNLEIVPQRITIEAGNSHGAFNAIQTIKQLFYITGFEDKKTIKIPTLKIQDKPAYSWRGVHLDVSRHFFNIDYLKKHIDRLAFYKFNKLHLHLTDDQGWRIEIKQYPKLTDEGAWRTYNKWDSICIDKSKDDPNFKIDPRYIYQKDGKDIYGGFYTQEEMKDLIRYAAERHIEIIPEVDMPGHMMAAIKAYPSLVDGGAGWGELFSTPICPCKDDVFTFCKNVLSEIITLFPSKYIHIGADEVDKKTWENSSICTEFMKKYNIENVDKLQSYFVHEMQKYVESQGKTLIGWDEVLDGGIDKNVTVMYWRGWVGDSPRKAVKGGNKVIMTPTNPLYFDAAHNSTSITNVYHMDIIYKNVPKDKKHLILGAQANVWTETIPTEQQAEFQMYPRMIALAERVWTDNTTRFEDFSGRLLKHYPVMDKMEINYRLPDIEALALENVYVDEAKFMLKSPLPQMKVHYTLDGSIPEITSPTLSKPITISQPETMKVALFSPKGVRGEVYNLNFRPSEMKDAVSVKSTKAGLVCDFYNKPYKETNKITGQPDESFIVSAIKAPKETNTFALRFDGYIDIPETGIYSFFFTCDDGGILYLDETIVIDNDGMHPPIMKSGQAAMKKGLHPFRLDFIEAGGGYTLKLQYSFNGSSPKDIPDEWFKY